MGVLHSMSSNDMNFSDRMDLYLDRPSFSIQNKPASNTLIEKAALTEQVRPSLRSKPKGKIQQTVTTSSVSNSLASRLMSCLGGVFGSSSMDQSASTLSSRDVSSIKVPTKIYVGSEEEETASTASISVSDDLYEPTSRDYKKLDEKINSCKNLHTELRSTRKEFLTVKQKESRLIDQGYAKNRHNVAAFTKGIAFSKALLQLMDSIEQAEDFMRRKKIPEDSAPAKELTVMKQLLLLEEHLQKNLILAHTSILHKEHNVISKTPDLSQWEEVCEHFEILSDEDLHTAWSNLKKTNSENLEQLTANFELRKKQTLNKKLRSTEL